jgi:heptosyltransferase-2
VASKILVIQTAFLGDLLLSIPLVKNTKRLYPNAEIHILCRKGFGDFFVKLNLVHKAIEIDKSHRESVVQAIASLQENEYETVLCPHQSLRSAFIAKSVKARVRVGFSRWWNVPFFNKRVERPMEMPDALRQLSLLKALNHEIEDFFVQAQDKSYLNMGAEVPDWSSMAIEMPRNQDLALKYGLENKIAFLAPGSVWNTKRWIKEKYVELGKRLQKEGFQVLIVGSPEEREYAEDIAKQIPQAKNIAGQPSLIELVQLYKFGNVLVTNDNGAMHLGSVAGIPTVAVFGPTTLALGYRPWNNLAQVVEDKNLKCRPCGKHGHKTCPIGTHDCMKNISVDSVTQAISKS